ncbi:unnamed protein product [Trichobilharzia regenti]|nr:unnamed protein product [Trichobilharzia regenti]
MSIQRLSIVPRNMQMTSKPSCIRSMNILKMTTGNRLINRSFVEIHSLYRYIKCTQNQQMNLQTLIQKTLHPLHQTYFQVSGIGFGVCKTIDCVKDCEQNMHKQFYFE